MRKIWEDASRSVLKAQPDVKDTLDVQWPDAVTRVKKLKNFRAKNIVIFEKILAVKILHFHEFSILTFWKADKGILGFPKYLEFERHQKCNRVADIYIEKSS